MAGIEGQIVPATRTVVFRFGDNVPRPVTNDLHRRLQQSPHAEVTLDNHSYAWTILHSFETAEYRQKSRKGLCVGVPFVEQFLADSTIASRIQESIFCLLLDTEIVFSEQFTKAEVTNMTRKVRWMGGSVAKIISPRCVVIAYDASLDTDSLYQQAVRTNVTVALPSWIDHLWSSQIEQQPTPLLPLHGLRLNGEVNHDDLKRTGAKIDQLEHCHVAIALTSCDDVVARARQYRIPVVGTQWLADSIKMGHALPVADYPVPEELPLVVSENSYLEEFCIDVSLLPEDTQPEACVEINNGGGMWSKSGEIHEECQLLNAVLVDVREGDKYTCAKETIWLKHSVTRGVPILKRDWLSACANAATLVPWKKYKTDVHFTEDANPRFLRVLKSSASLVHVPEPHGYPIEDQRPPRPSCGGSLRSTAPTIPESQNQSRRTEDFLFANLVFGYCGTLPEKEFYDSIKDQVARLGGKLVEGEQLLTESKLHYVVIEDGKRPSDFKELNLRGGTLRSKCVTSITWLQDCIRYKKIRSASNPLLPSWQPSILPLKQMKHIFAGCNFHLSNYAKQPSGTQTATLKDGYPTLAEDSTVKRLCYQLGASFCKHRAWNKVTHYIVIDPKVEMNERYKESKAREIPIVHYEWICDSFRSGRQLDMELYLVNFNRQSVTYNQDFYRKAPIEIMDDEVADQATPQTQSKPAKPLESFVLQFTPQALNDNPKIETIAQDLGAVIDDNKETVASDLTRVLICGNQEFTRKAVTMQWIIQCAKQQKNLPREDFAPLQVKVGKSAGRRVQRKD